MKKTAILSLVSIFLIAGPLYSFDMTNVVAYPVPFNPQSKVLTVGYPGGAVLSGYTVRVEIFDINGDLVVKKVRSQIPLKWNGRRGNGKRVKPGLYILRIRIENDEGDYGKKLIRILVDY